MRLTRRLLISAAIIRRLWVRKSFLDFTYPKFFPLTGYNLPFAYTSIRCFDSGEIRCPTSGKFTKRPSITGDLDLSFLSIVNQIDRTFAIDRLVIPDYYAQSQGNSEVVSGGASVMELLFPTNFFAGNAQIQLDRCPGASVFTSAPSTLEGALYDCCIEKSDSTKLAETHAFASFTMTAAILVSTVLFYFHKDNREDKKVMSDDASAWE